MLQKKVPKTPYKTDEKSDLFQYILPDSSVNFFKTMFNMQKKNNFGEYLPELPQFWKRFFKNVYFSR